MRIGTVPEGTEHNGHIFWVLARSGEDRASIMAKMAERGVETRSHYVPLHDSEGGRRFGRVAGTMERTLEAGERLFRLPIWNGVDSERVAETVVGALR